MAGSLSSQVIALWLDRLRAARGERWTGTALVGLAVSELTSADVTAEKVRGAAGSAIIKLSKNPTISVIGDLFFAPVEGSPIVKQPIDEITVVLALAHQRGRMKLEELLKQLTDKTATAKSRPGAARALLLVLKGLHYYGLVDRVDFGWQANRATRALAMAMRHGYGEDILLATVADTMLDSLPAGTMQATRTISEVLYSFTEDLFADSAKALVARIRVVLERHHNNGVSYSREEMVRQRLIGGIVSYAIRVGEKGIALSDLEVAMVEIQPDLFDLRDLFVIEQVEQLSEVRVLNIVEDRVYLTWHSPL